MGVMPTKAQATPTAAKRRSGQLDFSKLGPLKTSGTVGFSTFRDSEAQSSRRKKPKKLSNGNIGTAMDEDSDEDDDDDNDAILAKLEDVDTKYDKSKLGPEDAKFSGELADGVNRIRVNFNPPFFSTSLFTQAHNILQLKRAHSAEPDSAASSRKSPSAGPSTGDAATPPTATDSVFPPLSGISSAALFGKSLPEDSVIGSPLKKARPSISEGAGKGFGVGNASFSHALGDILAKAEASQAAQNKQQSPSTPPVTAMTTTTVKEEMEEEL